MNIILGIFEIFTAVKIHVSVFWVVTPCSDVVGYYNFGRPCCFHLHPSVTINLLILHSVFCSVTSFSEIDLRLKYVNMKANELLSFAAMHLETCAAVSLSTLFTFSW
jgi:hypothetical protein